MTPVQRKMLTVVGAKKVYGDRFCENVDLALAWVSEAIELLLLREIERAAVDDNVDISDLIEAVQDEGEAEMLEAAAAARKPC